MFKQTFSSLSRMLMPKLVFKLVCLILHFAFLFLGGVCVCAVIIYSILLTCSAASFFFDLRTDENKGFWELKKIENHSCLKNYYTMMFFNKRIIDM